MNVSVYLFGEFNSGYSQYPDDYASLIFKKFSANAKSTTQIAIHRDGNLMYYGYIRKLQQDRYLGICVVLNGLILKRVDGLFYLFENTIANLVTNGKLIHFNEQGDLITSVENLNFNREEIDLITESLRIGFKRFQAFSAPLPAVSYGTSKDSFKDFVVDDDQDKIIKSSYTNGYTYIYKSKGFNTSQLNSYKEVLSKAYKEKKELVEKYEELQEEHAKTLKQKKQFKLVFILFVILLGCAFFLSLLNNNLNITRYELSEANKTINNKNDTLSIQNDSLDNLRQKRFELESECEEAKNKLEEFKTEIRNRQPFIVKSTSFDFNSGKLSFNYYGVTEGYVTINVNAFNDNGECYTNSSDIYIYEGNNSASIFVNGYLDSNKWYSFELLKDNIILGGDRH